MIIKIITKDKDSQPSIFYDGFNKVAYRYINDIDADKIETDATWFVNGKFCCGDKCAAVILINANRLNGEEFTVKTNAITYLLNDEGKTIERIN
jgi:hypothetical protein